VFTALLTLGWTYDDVMGDVRPLLLEINNDPERDHEYDIVADALDPIWGWCAPEYRIHPPSVTTTLTELGPPALWEPVDRMARRPGSAPELEGAIRVLVVEGADPRVLVKRLGEIADRMATEGRSDDAARVRRANALIT
jgi:hypothetical protein